MISAAQHLHYLDAMGISVWQLRPTSPSISASTYQLLNAQGTVWAYLIAHINSSAEQALLDNILKALESQTAPFNEAPCEKLPWIVLGHDFASQIPAQLPSELKVIARSLSELLDHRAFKLELWQQLKILKPS